MLKSLGLQTKTEHLSRMILICGFWQLIGWILSVWQTADGDLWKLRHESQITLPSFPGRRRLRQNWEFCCRSPKMPLTSSSPTPRKPRRSRRSSRSESPLCVRCLWRPWKWRVSVIWFNFKWGAVQVQDVHIKGSSPDPHQVQTAGSALMGHGLKWTQRHLPIKRWRRGNKRLLKPPNQIKRMLNHVSLPGSNHVQPLQW